MPDRTIHERELRNNVSSILKEVARGGTFTITVHDRPMARLVPTGDVPQLAVSRGKLAGILNLPMDGAAMLAELDDAEASTD